MRFVIQFATSAICCGVAFGNELPSATPVSSSRARRMASCKGTPSRKGDAAPASATAPAPGIRRCDNVLVVLMASSSPTSTWCRKASVHASKVSAATRGGALRRLSSISRWIWANIHGVSVEYGLTAA
eukprot:2684584-Prymnesium_polylepis.1